MAPSNPAPDAAGWAALRQARRDLIASKKAARARYLELRKPAWEAFQVEVKKAREVQASLVKEAVDKYNAALQSLMVPA